MKLLCRAVLGTVKWALILAWCVVGYTLKYTVKLWEALECKKR